ncbi:MAG: 4-vinyl reductase [Candidatus Parvarchaeum sp.]|nr:4-vinyl reductase [Candidatus Parvarchaeum tengchongense]
MAKLIFERKFDSDRKRHYVNDNLVVLHCHHYSTLFSQLALDAKELVNGTKILFETMEDITFEMLSNYFAKHGIKEEKDRIDIATQTFSAIGLGKIVPVSINESGGEIEMPNSHVDQGWIKKWGQNKVPVNYIGAGYIAGMFRAIFGKPERFYKVTEIQSIVKGDKISRFKISS